MLTFRVWSFLKAMKKLLVICVVHIPVTGDTLFEKLMVTSQKTMYLLNRKRSLILGCYAGNLAVLSFSLPVVRLSHVLMQKICNNAAFAWLGS